MTTSTFQQLRIDCAPRGMTAERLLQYLNCITQYGKIPMRDEGGNHITGKAATTTKVYAWRDDLALPDDVPLAYHVVIMVVKDISTECLEAVVTAFLAEAIPDARPYLMVMHGAQPQMNCHAHILVGALSDDDADLALIQDSLTKVQSGQAV